MTINVTVGGTVIISTSSTLVDSERDHSMTDPAAPENVPTNVVRIEKAYLVTSALVDGVLERVYDYYQQRFLQKTKLFVPEPTLGNSVLVDTSIEGRKIGGIIEKMNTDLARGFVSDVEIVGVVKEVE